MIQDLSAGEELLSDKAVHCKYTILKCKDWEQQMLRFLMITGVKQS